MVIESKKKIPITGINQPQQFSQPFTTGSDLNPPKETTSSQPEIIRDQITGNITGAKFPNGKILMGNASEIKNQISLYTNKMATPTGAIEGSAAAANQQRIEEFMPMAAKIGELDKSILAQAETTPLRYGQALGAGLNVGGTAAAGGAVVGAASGLVGSGGTLSIPAAAILGSLGGVGGFITGTYQNLKAQRKGVVDIKAGSLNEGITNLKSLIKYANSDPQNAEEYYRAFNEQLSYIERDHGSLKMDTNGWFKTLNDGDPQLADYQRFDDMQRELLIINMKTALITPDPKKALQLGISDIAT
jgi:hypothetical protein